MDLEKLKNTFEKINYEIEKKVSNIKWAIFICVFIAIFYVIDAYSTESTQLENFIFTLLLSIYPGIFIFFEIDSFVKWMLKFSDRFNELLCKRDETINQIKIELEKIRSEKNKEGARNIDRLNSIFKRIFNKKINDSTVNESERFFLLLNDLNTNSNYFDTDLTNKLDYFNSYSKSLKSRTQNYLQDNNKPSEKQEQADTNSPLVTIVDNKEEKISEDNKNFKDLELDLMNTHKKEKQTPNTRDELEKNYSEKSAKEIPIHLNSFENIKSERSLRNTEKNNWKNNMIININYEKLNQQKLELGQKGELIVFDWEKNNLEEKGLPELAEKVKHISRDIGDGAGFDILSFDENGQEKYIEVKTTKNGLASQFYFTDNELNFIKNNDNYFLYRLSLEDERQAELYIIRKENILDGFDIVPYQYIARLRKD